MAQFNSVKRAPSKGTPGDAYFLPSSGELFIAIADGTLVPLDGLLTPNPRGPVGPQGEQGLPGKDSVVPGPAGLPGRDGRSCTCSNRGEKGDTGSQGPQGPRGEKGEPGSVLYIGPTELETAIHKVRAELIAQRARVHAAIEQEIADAQHLPPALRLLMQQALNKVKVTAEK